MQGRRLRIDRVVGAVVVVGLIAGGSWWAITESDREEKSPEPVGSQEVSPSPEFSGVQPELKEEVSLFRELEIKELSKEVALRESELKEVSKEVVSLREDIERRSSSPVEPALSAPTSATGYWPTATRSSPWTT